MRDALSRALRDDSLEVAFPLPGGGQVDAAGQTVRLTEAAGRAVTVLERDGAPIAALRYDATADPGLVREAAAAAGLALQNERLRAEALARLDEVRQSRARILAASDAARRSVERDLHDGAQQRLIALGLDLQVVRSTLARDPAAAGELLEAAIGDLGEAIDELRELARGIHPAILTERGLGPALAALARRSPIPASVEIVADERPPLAVEATAYFVVSEALTNAVKHSGASAVEIAVLRTADVLIAAVADDGVGGADPRSGSGLGGLVDRVAALGGNLVVHSPPEGGTRVEALIPCAS